MAGKILGRLVAWVFQGQHWSGNNLCGIFRSDGRKQASWQLHQYNYRERLFEWQTVVANYQTELAEAEGSFRLLSGQSNY
ncbi:MAG: hypothetical protein R3B47_00875 [Bacteroidia bacterium]